MEGCDLSCRFSIVVDGRSRKPKEECDARSRCTTVFETHIIDELARTWLQYGFEEQKIPATG
jgi:hypothetical protein